MRRQLFCIALLAALATGDVFAQPPSDGKGTDKRTALIIGNAAYTAGRLNNPVLDARSMAETLKALGFEVLAHENLSYRDMRRAVAEFGERLVNGGVGLFYYSGHGVQVGGRNYLVPVDADIKNERYVAAEAIDTDNVLLQMQEAKTRVNVVILDACRDNPFSARTRGLGRGLALMDVPGGTYVAYSTAPGSIAEDGDPGQNGIYTGELLKTLKEPGLRIEDVFKRVRIAVQSRTQSRQNPWDASSMTGDFVFNAAGPIIVAAPAASAAPVVPQPIVREEVRTEIGVLALSARVDGVEMFLGDQRIGEARLGRALVVENLPVGTHRIRAVRPGYKTWEGQAQVGANQRTDLVIDLEQE